VFINKHFSSLFTVGGTYAYTQAYCFFGMFPIETIEKDVYIEISLMIPAVILVHSKRKGFSRHPNRMLRNFSAVNLRSVMGLSY